MQTMALVGLVGVVTQSTVPNMNGDYVLSKTLHAPKDKDFPTNFMSYPGGVESFDAYYGPIKSTYSQVWWTSASDDLPDDVVKKFDGKVIAIVGMEMDQVRRTADGDVPVPINIAYNHHHNTMITGKATSMQKVAMGDPRVAAAGPHGYMKMSGGTHAWLPVEHTPSGTGMPTSAMMDDGNGGEYRKTFHGYAPPFAQLVESPTVINGIAMQIDTWNREKMNLTGSPFVPGPVPKHSLAPLTGPDAIYSGLLECPLTTRVQKLPDPGSEGFNDTYTARVFTTCHAPAAPAAPTPRRGDSDGAFCVEQNVNGVSGDITTPGISTASLTYYGKVASGDACEAACKTVAACQSFTWISPSFGQKVWADMCYLRHAGRMGHSPQGGIETGWRGPNCGDGPPPPPPPPSQPKCAKSVASAAECFAQARLLRGLDNATLSTEAVHSPDVPPGCTVTTTVGGSLSANAVFNSNNASAQCCGIDSLSAVSGMVATLQNKVSMRLHLSRGNPGTNASSSSAATITLTGPAATWFGVGFNAMLMSDNPYAIVCDGNGDVTERKLSDQAPGVQLAPSVAVVSNTVTDGVRTVVVTRPLQGATAAYYTFDRTQLSLNFISAIGMAASFGPHGDAPHGSDTLTMWPVGSPVCVCVTPAAKFGSASGRWRYLPTGQVVGGYNKCAPFPRMDLLEQRNPTCDYRTYVGGLHTCLHGWHLLDAEQEIPWPDQPLEYYKKFRMYYQEYNASHHRQITRVDWSPTPGEYDVPTCAADGIPAGPNANCNHTIQGAWEVAKAGGAPVYLAAIHHHCHAPTCLAVRTYNNDTGELLCESTPIYGGTGAFVGDRNKTYDEPGYIATNPCIWGREEDGLAPPPVMNGVTVKVVAITNTTHGHHGEMAIAQAMLSDGPFP